MDVRFRAVSREKGFVEHNVSFSLGSSTVYGIWYA